MSIIHRNIYRHISSKLFAHTWRKINNKSYYLFLLNAFSFELYWFYLRPVCWGSQAFRLRIIPSASMDAIFINSQFICRHQKIFTMVSGRIGLKKKGEDGDKTRRIIDCKSVDNSNQFSQFASIYLRNPKYRTVTAALCVRTAFEKLYELYFLLTISSTMVVLRRSSDSNLQLHRSGTNWNPILSRAFINPNFSSIFEVLRRERQKNSRKIFSKRHLKLAKLLSLWSSQHFEAWKSFTLCSAEFTLLCE